MHWKTSPGPQSAESTSVVFFSSDLSCVSFCRETVISHPVLSVVLARIALVIAASSCLLAAHAADVAATLTEFQRCQIQSLEAPTQRSAHCATLSVPEDYAATSGPQIELFVARISSLSRAKQSDPLLLINGGPGASAVDLYLSLGSVLDPILDERDIILLDQRGTGRSHPMDCAVDLNGRDLSPSTADIARSTAECLQQLPGDPRQYTTSNAVQDLEQLRQLLSAPLINLYGVSYGTRVALHYLRRFPDNARSLVLDGVLPPEIVLGPNVALNAQTTLDAIFERCASAPACNAQFPELGERFTALAKTLRQTPPEIELTHPITGDRELIELDYNQLAMVIRLLSYAPETAALIPLTIAQASSGNLGGLAGQAAMFSDRLTRSLNAGMHNSVVCSEDAPAYPDIDAELDQAQLEASYIGADQYGALKTLCDLWPAGPTDDDFRQPITAQAPVLVLSGEFDPITPPAYGEQLDAALANSTHFIAPGQGHGVIARGCIPRVAAHFIRTADLASTARAEDGCIDELDAMPFFLNTMGPVAP